MGKVDKFRADLEIEVEWYIRSHRHKLGRMLFVHRHPTYAFVFDEVYRRLNGPDKKGAKDVDSRANQGA